MDASSQLFLPPRFQSKSALQGQRAGPPSGGGPEADVADAGGSTGSFARLLQAATSTVGVAPQRPEAAAPARAPAGPTGQAVPADPGQVLSPRTATAETAETVATVATVATAEAVEAVVTGARLQDTAAASAAPPPWLRRALDEGRAELRKQLPAQEQAPTPADMPPNACTEGRGVCGPGVRAGGRAPVAAGVDLAEPVAVESTHVAGPSVRAESADTTDQASAATPVLDGTALMQWMVQMAPPPSTAPSRVPVETGRIGLGKPDGQALRPAGRDTADRFTSAVSAGRGNEESLAVGRPADRAGAADFAIAAHQGARPVSPEPVAAATAPVRAPVATAAMGLAAVPADAGRTAESSRGAMPSGLVDAQALLPAAAQAAAQAAAASSTVTANGSPAVAPAQTWIQTPVTQPGFSDEVVVALVRQVGQATQGVQEVKLHLNPVELGPVSVSIELQGNTARIEFGASEALTRQHLEAALPGLTEALQGEGLSLTHSRVHEVSKEALAAGATGTDAFAGSSSGSGSDARQRGEPLFDGQSGQGERAPRRETEVFSLDGRAVAATRESAASGPSPGRAGRLDLFA